MIRSIDGRLVTNTLLHKCDCRARTSLGEIVIACLLRLNRGKAKKGSFLHLLQSLRLKAYNTVKKAAIRLTQMQITLRYLSLLVLSFLLIASPNSYGEETTSSHRIKREPDLAKQALSEWLEGNNYLQRGMDRDALKRYRSAVAKSPNEKRYTKSLIWTLQECGLEKEAVQISAKANSLWPDDVDLLDSSHAPASAYYKTAEHMRHKLQSSPHDREAQLTLARSLLPLDSKEAGILLIIQCLCNRRNDSVEPCLYMLPYLTPFFDHSKLGPIARQLYKLELKSALEAAKNDRRLLRVAVLNAHSPDDQTFLAQKYCEQFGGHPFISLLVSLTRKDGCSAYAQSVFARIPNEESKLEFEQIFYLCMHQNYELARSIGNTLIAKYPLNVDGYLRMTTLEDFLGHPDRGERVLQLAATRCPTNATVLFKLASHLASHDLSLANATFERAMHYDRHGEAFSTALDIASTASKKKHSQLSRKYLTLAAQLIDDDSKNWTFCEVARKLNFQDISGVIENRWAEHQIKLAREDSNIASSLMKDASPKRETETRLLLEFLKAWRSAAVDACGAQLLTDNKTDSAIRFYEELTKLTADDPMVFLRLSQALCNKPALPHSRKAAILACKRADRLARRLRENNDSIRDDTADFYQLLAYLQLVLKLSEATDTLKLLAASGIKNKALYESTLPWTVAEGTDEDIRIVVNAYLRSGGTNATVERVVTETMNSINPKTQDWISHYQRFSRLVHVPLGLHYHAACLLADQRSYEQACSAISLAIRDAPTQHIFFEKRAQFYLLMNHRDLAIADISKARSLGSKGLTLNKLEGRLQKRKGGLDGYESTLLGRSVPVDSAHSANAGSSEQLRAAETALALGRYEEAFQRAAALDRSDPGNPRAIRTMAIAAQAKGDYKTASELRERLMLITREKRQE